MFNVTFTKYVFDAKSADEDSRFAVLDREESMPFVPVAGHEIQWPLERSLKIVTCTWHTERQAFVCRVEDEYTVNIQVDAPDFDEVLEHAPEHGWRVASIYPARR